MSSDWIKTNERLQFVRDQLSSYSGVSRKGPEGSTFVLCPFHSEKTPSLRIFHGNDSRNPGWGKCYGCGEQGSWNKIAPALGLAPFGPQKPTEAYARPFSLSDEDSDESTTEDLKFEPLPKNKKWRGIPTNFLRKLGCKVYINQWGYKGVFLPVDVGNEQRGYIKARFRKDDNPVKSERRPSYVNKKGSWVKTHGLFLFDQSLTVLKKRKTRTVVLVEGPRDALVLLMKGIPAMAILGTHSWTDAKRRLLETYGVRRVVVLMDGDEAGNKAADLLMSSLPLLFKVKRIDCPLDKDPATLDPEDYTRLQKLTR